MSTAELERERRFHLEHAGHEAAHDEMFLILILVLIATQIAIVHWRKRHVKSFQAFTLFALWLFPVPISLRAGFYRFLLVWIGFSVVNAWIIKLAAARPLSRKTPRIVYRWFAWCYRVTYAIGMVGYITFILVLFGAVDLFFSPDTVAEFVIDCFGYGLYFGVLTKDFVDVCTDRMAATAGYYRPGEALPSKSLNSSTCAICGSSIRDSPTVDTVFVADTADEDEYLGHDPLDPVEHEELRDDQDDESARSLGCGHRFHRACIRGWCMIGKRDTCPYCKEKVDLRAFRKNPWDTQQYFYLLILEWVRYLVVWQPIVIILLKLIYSTLGLR